MAYHKIKGVNLINTQYLDNIAENMPNSYANKVSNDSIFARAHYYWSSAQGRESSYNCHVENIAKTYQIVMPTRLAMVAYLLEHTITDHQLKDVNPDTI